MEIQFSNPIHSVIADMMWAANSLDEVSDIRRAFKVEGEVVYQMIVAAAIDDEVAVEEDFTIANQVLESIK
jgi:hypothetical protein